MRENRPQTDPRSRFEDEGIPDLQEGTPGRQWAEDPEEMPLPGDRPLGVDEYGTTTTERREGEPHDLRLSREEPDLDADSYAGGEPGRAGRLVDPDGGMGVDTEKDLIAEDVGPDVGGYTAEEQAMRVEDETP